jgi:hypothetical protein
MYERSPRPLENPMKTSLALALIATTATTASAQPSPASPATPETAQGPAAAAAPDRQASPVDATLPAAPVDRAALAASIDAQIDARVSARVDEILAARPEKAGWNDGFYLQSGDGKHKLRFGAIIQFEGRIFFADEDDPRTDQWTFRSLRPELAGTLFGRFDFRLMPDFAGGRLSVQDAYVDLRATDAVRLRFGKFKVPFGLERLQSETTTLFA